MNSPPRTRNLSFDGPVGRLEALLDVPATTELAGRAVVCHPHPQHGGTMHNKVAHTLARAFVKCGFATLRFNFRGTEGSEGNFDEGRGELDDALAAIDWMRSNHPGGPMWLGGFSFGAAIVIRAAVETGVDGLVSVAPAVARFAAGLERQPQCPWLIVQGDEDELVRVDDTIEWVNELSPGPELSIIRGAEHFFHGRLVELRENVVAFVSTSL